MRKRTVDDGHRHAGVVSRGRHCGRWFVRTEAARDGATAIHLCTSGGGTGCGWDAGLLNESLATLSRLTGCSAGWPIDWLVDGLAGWLVWVRGVRK